MKCWSQSFNIYLWAAAAVVLFGAGCGSTGTLSVKKDYATLRVYLEASPANGTLVDVGPDKVPVYVENNPFITEEDLNHASLVENADGTTGIRVTFSDHGGLVVDMTTSGNRGKHMVFNCQLRPHQIAKETSDSDTASDEKPAGPFNPWVSMTLIRSGIQGGSLQFTPDVTHEQAQLIVRGLNNIVSEINKMEN